MKNIKEDEFYKTLYSLTEVQVKISQYTYNIKIFGDVVEIQKYIKKNKILESFEENPIYMYKEAIQVLNMISKNYEKLDKKIIKISDDVENYFNRIDLQKSENGDYVIQRCYQESIIKNDKKEFSEDKNILTFDSVNEAKKFYEILKDEIENADIDFI